MMNDHELAAGRLEPPKSRDDTNTKSHHVRSPLSRTSHQGRNQLGTTQATSCGLPPPYGITLMDPHEASGSSRHSVVTGSLHKSGGSRSKAFRGKISCT